MTPREKLVQFAVTLADERSEASEIVASIRANLAEVWEKPLRDEWKTVGVVRELIDASNAMVERNPPEARELAQLAVAIASVLPNDRYRDVARAESEGLAFRVLGVAHGYLYQHNAALRAFDAAERAFRRNPALGHEAATVAFARANTFSAMNRHDEAVSLLDTAATELAEYGDHANVVKCKLLSAIVAYRRGDYDVARRGFEQTLAEALRGDDLHTLTACYSNLATVCIALRDFSAAVQALQSARELIAALDMPTELARTDWSIGKILLQQGNYPKAIEALTDVRERFLSWRMIDEAGLVALYIVDALLALDDRRSAVALAETVIVDFRGANLNERALTALAYLRDLLPHAGRPQRSIDHVRNYLESLRREPARIFVPLPE